MKSLNNNMEKAFISKLKQLKKKLKKSKTIIKTNLKLIQNKL